MKTMDGDEIFPNKRLAGVEADRRTAALPFGSGRFYVADAHGYDGYVLQFAAPGPYVAVERSTKVNPDVLAFCTRSGIGR